MPHETKNQSRLLARVIAELLKRQRFDSLADLTEAVKCECARLKLLVTADAIGDAFRLISSNTPLVRKSGSSPVAPAPSSAAIGRSEAQGLLHEIEDRCGVRLVVRTMEGR